MKFFLALFMLAFLLSSCSEPKISRIFYSALDDPDSYWLIGAIYENNSFRILAIEGAISEGKFNKNKVIVRRKLGGWETYEVVENTVVYVAADGGIIFLPIDSKLIISDFALLDQLGPELENTIRAAFQR